jgi:hypothetical protein
MRPGTIFPIGLYRNAVANQAPGTKVLVSNKASSLKVNKPQAKPEAAKARYELYYWSMQNRLANQISISSFDNFLLYLSTGTTGI